MGISQGTSVDVQASQHDSTAHHQGVSHLKGKTDDHDIITMSSQHTDYVM